MLLNDVVYEILSDGDPDDRPKGYKLNLFLTVKIKLNIEEVDQKIGEIFEEIHEDIDLGQNFSNTLKAIKKDPIFDQIKQRDDLVRKSTFSPIISSQMIISNNVS